MAKTVLDETHPLVLGPVGAFGRTAANIALHREADLVVAVGVSFSWLTSAGWSAHLGSERLVRVDLDTAELDRNYSSATTVHADAAEFFQCLAVELSDYRRDGSARVAALNAEYPDQVAVHTEPERLHPIEVCEIVSDTLDEATSVVADVGQFAYWVERHVRTRGNGRFLINGGLGSMGHAVAGALGVWTARKEANVTERVLCLCGDGGFMMGAPEVATAVKAGANLVWLIFNDHELGTQADWFARRGHSDSLTANPDVDFVSMAHSMGAQATRVTSADDLRTALNTALKGGCHVLDVAVMSGSPPLEFEGLL